MRPSEFAEVEGGQQVTGHWDQQDGKFLTNETHWRGGPTFDLAMYYRTLAAGASALRALVGSSHVAGPYNSVAAIGTEAVGAHTGAIVSPQHVVLTDPGNAVPAMGARVIWRDYTNECMSSFLLAFYPPHMERICPTYPLQSAAEWLSREVIAFHVLLLHLARMVHSIVPFRFAAICSEGDLWYSPTAEGIAIDRQIAIATHQKVIQEFDRFSLVSVACDSQCEKGR